jgi:hypothetical protein
MDFNDPRTLHDANLLGIDLDVGNGSATFRLAAREIHQPPRRVRLKLTFQGMRGFSATLDLAELKTHARFGSISEWTPVSGRNLVSLAVGLIIFEAESFAVSHPMSRRRETTPSKRSHE